MPEALTWAFDLAALAVIGWSVVELGFKRGKAA